MINSLAAITLIGGLVGLLNDQQLALFVGPNAATWDQDQYLVAAQMKLDGKAPAEILSKTGFWWGPDGKARMELDDSQSKVTGKTGTLGEALDHEELYKAYPDLRNLPADVKIVGQDKTPGLWGYVPPTEGNAERIVMHAYPNAVRRGLIHEIQHSIQYKEGFEQGGLPKGAGFGAVLEYEQLMGEAEARAAAGRLSLTSPERNVEFPPWTSYDTPPDQLRRK